MEKLDLDHLYYRLDMARNLISLFQEMSSDEYPEKLTNSKNNPYDAAAICFIERFPMMLSMINAAVSILNKEVQILEKELGI